LLVALVLLFHEATNDVAGGNLEYIKSGYMSLGARTKGMGS